MRCVSLLKRSNDTINQLGIRGQQESMLCVGRIAIQESEIGVGSQDKMDQAEVPNPGSQEEKVVFEKLWRTLARLKKSGIQEKCVSGFFTDILKSNDNTNITIHLLRIAMKKTFCKLITDFN